MNSLSLIKACVCAIHGSLCQSMAACASPQPPMHGSLKTSVMAVHSHKLQRVQHTSGTAQTVNPP